MKKYIDFVSEFHNGNPKEIDFINNQLHKHLIDNIENQTDIETILDYLFSNPNVDISKIGYKTILGKTEKRHKKLQQVSTKDNEKEGIDYETILDFKDGFKFVKLISNDCYKREGKLMSNCVASYYGRDVEIYSLRDENNKPHCTIEKDQQVKGKGNGKIDPKYVDYVVKFLEELGMTVGENEMKNLGYYKLDSIDKGLSCEKLYNGYVYESNLSEIKDSEGDKYMGFGLLKIKKILDIKLDFTVKMNFDIDVMCKYLINKISSKKIDSVANRYNSTAVANREYSTAVANRYYSAAVANSYNSTAVANSYNSTAVANSSSSTAVANDHSSTAVANRYYSTAVANSFNSTAVANSYNSTAVANSSYSTAVANRYNSTAVANREYSTAVANSSSSTAVANDSYSTAVANREYSTAVANDKNSIALCRGYDSKAKGKIGAWLVIALYDNKKENIIDIIKGKVDGIKIKEDTYYMAKGKRLVEYVEEK